MPDASVSAFERIKHEDEQGEYWSARELAALLGYTVWRHFEEVIEEAIEVCRTNGGEAAVAPNFAATVKNSPGESKRGRKGVDYRLTRHACYLVAESADGRKAEVALAKIYFALTTERYELLATNEEERARLEERRLLARENAELALRAREAGVITSRQFADFFNSGYVGMYRETVAQIRARKGLTPRQDIADHMGSLELSANHFRAALARHHMDERDVRTVGHANATHHEAGASVREFLLSQGVTPEALPKPSKSYQQLLREEEARQRIAAEDRMGLWGLLDSPDDPPDTEE